MKKTMLLLIFISLFYPVRSQEGISIYVNGEGTWRETISIYGDSVYSIIQDANIPCQYKNEFGRIVRPTYGDTVWFSPYAESNIDTVIESFDSTVDGYRIYVMTVTGNVFTDFWRSVIIHTADGDDRYDRSANATVINYVINPYTKPPTGFSFLFFSERGDRWIHYDVIDPTANMFTFVVSGFMAPEIMSDAWKEWYAKKGIIRDDCIVVSGKRYYKVE